MQYRGQARPPAGQRMHHDGGFIRGPGKILGVYTYAVSFPRAARIDLPTYTLCNCRVTDVGCVSYMQS